MSIAQKAVRGAAWSIVASLATRGLALVGTLVLMRFVAPDDYGVFAAASVLVGSANALSTVGTGAYLIVNPSAGRAVTFHATLLHVGLGALGFGVVMLFGNRLGPAFAAPEVVRYVPGLVLAAFLERVAYIPERVLLRELRFGEVSAMRTASELVFTASSLALAALGWGGMALVVASILRGAVKLAITGLRAAWREWLEPHRLDASIAKKLSSFGAAFYLAGIAVYASRRWDNLLVSRFFGPGVLGTYNFAYNLADVPAVNVGEQVTDVLMASLAHVPREQQRIALVRTTGALALMMFPLAIGLGAVADTLTATLLKKSWEGVAPLLTLLSVLSVPRPIAGAFFAYLQAGKRPRDAAALEVVSAIVLLGLLATVGRHSPEVACLAVGLGFVVRMLLAMYFVQRIDGTPMTRFLGQLWAPLLACVPLALAVWGTRRGLGRLGFAPGVVMLVAEIAAGAIAFVLAAFVFARGPMTEVVQMVRRRRVSVASDDQ